MPQKKNKNMPEQGRGDRTFIPIALALILASILAFWAIAGIDQTVAQPMPQNNDTPHENNETNVTEAQVIVLPPRVID